jgi:SHS2 domain-containing protein
VSLFIEASALDNFSDVGVPDCRSQRVENREDEPFSQRHLEANVFAPASAHHARRKEFYCRVSVGGFNPEELLNFSDSFHVREFFGGLAREKTGSGKRWCTVEPMAALNTGDFAVEKLVEYPAEEVSILVLTRIEAGGAEFVLQLISLDQHMKRVYNSLMAVEITEWTDRTGRTFPHLQARGKSLTEAFRTAATGFFGLITDVETIRPTVEVVIFCESSDSDWLFSDWINTLIYEVRERRMLFSEFLVEVDGINVKGKIRGEAIDPKRHPLKREHLSGAAFDELFAEEGPEGARVSVVLNDGERHPLPLRALWK